MGILTNSVGFVRSPTRNIKLKQPSRVPDRSYIITAVLPKVLGIGVWLGMIAVPLILTSNTSLSYRVVFPVEWYETEHRHDEPSSSWPSPLGLFLGFFAVFVGQVSVVLFFFCYRQWGGGKWLNFTLRSVQTKGAPEYEFWDAVSDHFANPEGFVLIGSYLAGSWMFRWMPESYYSFEGGVSVTDVFLSLVLQDGFQYVMHKLEHNLPGHLYAVCHKPHHKFTNPKMFDAFNGSLADTFLMILVPFVLTAQCVRTANVWSYMAFGSLYSGWLTMLHSEYTLPWDTIFRKLGLGTSADHHVHHKVYKYNYGHLFMWFDMVGGSYKDPKELAPKLFNHGV